MASILTTAMVAYAVVLSFHWQTDFEVYRTGGQHVFGPDLYAPHVNPQGHRLFTYPPFAALVFWPISHLTSATGQLLWYVAQVVALAGLLAVSSAGARRRSPKRDDWQLALIALAPAGLLLWPVRLGLDLGQINVILILMIVTDLTIDLSWRGRGLPRGILVGIAAAVKLTPLIFVPYLLLTRQWRTARTAVLTFVLVTGVMTALTPSATWSYFTNDVFDLRRIGSSTITANQTIRAALTRMGLGGSRVFVDLLLVFVFCAGLGLATLAYGRSSPMLGMLVCAATGLLVSPISWVHHYVWCVPLLVWLVVGVDRPRRCAVWTIPVVLIFTVVPPPHPVGSSFILDVRENVDVLGTLALVGLGGLFIVRRRRPPANGTGNVAVGSARDQTVGAPDDSLRSPWRNFSRIASATFTRNSEVSVI